MRPHCAVVQCYLSLAAESMCTSGRFALSLHKQPQRHASHNANSSMALLLLCCSAFTCTDATGNGRQHHSCNCNHQCHHCWLHCHGSNQGPHGSARCLQGDWLITATMFLLCHCRQGCNFLFLTYCTRKQNRKSFQIAMLLADHTCMQFLCVSAWPVRQMLSCP